MKCFAVVVNGGKVYYIYLAGWTTGTDLEWKGKLIVGNFNGGDNCVIKWKMSELKNLNVLKDKLKCDPIQTPPVDSFAFVVGEDIKFLMQCKAKDGKNQNVTALFALDNEKKNWSYYP